MTTRTPRPVPDLDRVVAAGQVPAGPASSGPPPAASNPRPSPAEPPTPTATTVPGPWRTSRFWVLQLVVLAIALVRLAVTVGFDLSSTSLTVELSTLVLFVVPVVYGAMTFGLAGALFTATWVTILCLPRIGVAVDDHNFDAAWVEVVQVVVLDSLALLIGQRTSAEQAARRQVDQSRASLQRSEALYHGLFDSNLAPILIVDADGRVEDANPAAFQLFGLPAGGPGSRSSERLVDMVGPVAAARILARLISVGSHGPNDGDEGSDHGPDNSDGADTVAFEAGTDTIVYRLSATHLGGPRDSSRRLQVVFEDVTEETRRRDVMQAYAARVVHGQEDERRHLAQELHDGPLQEMILLCRQIDTLTESGTGGLASPDGLAELRNTAEDAVTELRSIARGLRPPVLDDLGLVASLGQLVNEAQRRGAFAASLGVNGVERRLPAAIELALFRIAQEGLANAEKHAGATHVAVGLDFEAGGVRLLVKDDGVGFDTAAGPANEGSLGVPGMTERARLVGGNLVVHAAEGRGCTVDAWVPTTD